MDDEIAPVLLVLAAPDELRVEVAVAAFIGDADWVQLLLIDDGLVFRRGNILPLVSVVDEGFDGLRLVVFLAMTSFLAPPAERLRRQSSC